jgi:uncharacterized protein
LIQRSPEHWRQVEAFALAIAQQNGADPEFVRLFAVLHDSCREDEMADPDHGLRAANLAQGLHGRLFHLPEPMLERLLIACRDHDKGLTSADLHIGTCWDADRLDLPRVGIIPDARFFSTQTARTMLPKPRTL